MRCKKCHSTIQKNAEYCDQCGTKIEFNKNNNTLIKIIIISFLILMIILGLKISMQQLRYSSYLKSAQENADDNKYIEALVYCAMASHIKPKQEDPYLKMADYYMKRSESNQAYAVLNIGITKAKKQEELYAKQEEIQSFADEDVLEKEIMIPEYVETEGIRRKKDVKNLIQELKEYYGTDDNEYGEIAKYYKGYYYFVEENTIFRTDRDETTKEEVYRLDWLKEISSLKIVNDKIFYTAFDFGDDFDGDYLIAAIDLNGTNNQTYDWSNSSSFFIHRGWLYYEMFNKDEKANSVSKLKKISIQGYDSEVLVENDPELVRQGYYYSVDEKNQIKKISMKNNRKKETIVYTPSEIKKANDTESIYIGFTENVNNKYLFYSIIWENSDNQKSALYLYDLEKNKERKIDQIDGWYGIYRITEKWLYIKNGYDQSLSRINIENHKREVLGQSMNFGWNFTVCNNKIISEIVNSNYGHRTIFLDTENGKANQRKLDSLDDR